jgi:hypothetical protein
MHHLLSTVPRHLKESRLRQPQCPKSREPRRDSVSQCVHRIFSEYTTFISIICFAFFKIAVNAKNRIRRE